MEKQKMRLVKLLKKLSHWEIKAKRNQINLFQERKLLPNRRFAILVSKRVISFCKSRQAATHQTITAKR